MYAWVKKKDQLPNFGHDCKININTNWQIETL